MILVEVVSEHVAFLYHVVAYSSPFVAIIWCIVACLKKQLTSSICVCLNHIFCVKLLLTI
jgi:hypothetical protein